MVKLKITLTWSKIMATTILLAGTVFAIMLLGQGAKAEATQIFSTCIVTAAGLLGCRQAANAVRSRWQNNNGSEILDP
jgi:hypothetical protein